MKRCASCRHGACARGYEFIEAEDGLPLLAPLMSAHRDGVPTGVVVKQRLRRSLRGPEL